MTLLSGLLVLALLCAVALCVGAATGLDPAVLPLPALAAAVLVLLAAGCLGVLSAGLWLALSLWLLAAVYCGFRAGWNALGQACASPALWLFASSSAFFWVLFAVHQPMFQLWDEFPIWGAAAKMLKIKNALYVAQPYNLTAYHTFPAGGLTSYLFQTFAPDFSEWGCLAALDTLAMACAAAVAAIPKRKKRWPGSVLLFTAAALTPLLFSVLPAGAFSTVYQTAMIDVSVGMVFGAVLCLYFGAADRRTGLLLALLPLALLVLLKDICFAYGLMAAFLMALDRLFCAPKGETPGRRVLAAFATGVLAALPVLAAFVAWNRYVAVADTAATADGSVGQAGLSYGAVLLGGVRQLLGFGREEKFARLMQLMGAAFTGRRVFLAGSGLVAVLAALGLAVLACLTAPSGKLRPLVAFLGLGFCFAALYAFHLILYHYNFSELEALVLKDYERYLSPYYIGWFLLLFCLLGQAAGRMSTSALGGAVLALVALVAWRGVPVAGFWSNADSLYTVRTDVRANTTAFNEALDWDDRVLVLSQGDDATRWYYYKFDLTATVVNGWYVEEETGQKRRGDFMNLVSADDTALYTYTTPGTLQDLLDHLAEVDAGYLIIDRSDGYLAAELGPVMAGGLTEDAPAALYRYEAGRTPCFTPVMVLESGVSAG